MHKMNKRISVLFVCGLLLICLAFQFNLNIRTSSFLEAKKEGEFYESEKIELKKYSDSNLLCDDADMAISSNLLHIDEPFVTTTALNITKILSVFTAQFSNHSPPGSLV